MFGDASDQDAEGHKADNEVDFALEEEILSRGTIMAIIKKRSRSTSELHMIRLSSALEARGVGEVRLVAYLGLAVYLYVPRLVFRLTAATIRCVLRY
jgi:hypothetical protein